MADLDKKLNDEQVTDNAQTQEANVEAQIAELYIATFDRAPDEAGLNYWVDQYNNGMSVDEIAKSFFDQPETKEKYSDGDIDSFIDSVYENVLDRKPDDAGKDYWKDQLDNGNISKDKFIIAILNGAKDHQDDAKHLMDKTDVGLAFVKDGLNDVDLAKTVIEQFKAVGDKDAVITALKDFSEQHKADDKIDDSELQDFSKLVENDHQELLKQNGDDSNVANDSDYNQNDSDASNSNVDDSYTNGDDSADNQNSDDSVQLAGTDSDADSSNGGTGGASYGSTSGDGVAGY